MKIAISGLPAEMSMAWSDVPIGRFARSSGNTEHVYLKLNSETALAFLAPPYATPSSYVPPVVHSHFASNFTLLPASVAITLGGE